MQCEQDERDDFCLFEVSVTDDEYGRFVNVNLRRDAHPFVFTLRIHLLTHCNSVPVLIAAPTQHIILFQLVIGHIQCMQLLLYTVRSVHYCTVTHIIGKFVTREFSNLTLTLPLVCPVPLWG